MAIMRRSTVCVRATNACVTHTEGDVINDLPHPLMMMNLIILRKSGPAKTGLAGPVPPPLKSAINLKVCIARFSSEFPAVRKNELRTAFCGYTKPYIYIQLQYHDISITLTNDSASKHSAAGWLGLRPTSNTAASLPRDCIAHVSLSHSGCVGEEKALVVESSPIYPQGCQYS